MRQVRAFMRQDVPAVAALLQKVFGTADGAGPPHLASYLENALLAGPWYDEALSSLVCLADDDRVAGFLGVLPRPMVLGGTRLRTAVSTKFAVDAEVGRGWAAVSLLKAFLARPHDLVFADVGSDDMRRLWEAVGGTTVLLYSLHWRRRLQPCRYAASWVRKHTVYGPFAWALLPLCVPADALFARLHVNRFHAPPGESTSAELDEETFLRHYAELAGPGALRLEFDRPALRWTLEIAAATRPHSALHKSVVRNARGEILGWYMFFRDPGGDTDVIHFLSRADATSEVLAHLYAEAWRRGAATVSGRLNPQQMRGVSAQHAVISSGPPWMLVHSSRPEVLEAIHRGNAYLSRLEGEW